MRKITRLALGLAIVTGVIAAPSAGFAHAEVVSASPAPGSTIDAAVTDGDNRSQRVAEVVSALEADLRSYIA